MTLNRAVRPGRSTTSMLQELEVLQDTSPDIGTISGNTQYSVPEAALSKSPGTYCRGRDHRARLTDRETRCFPTTYLATTSPEPERQTPRGIYNDTIQGK